MYNSHYVPQFILHMFGGHFDDYTADTQKFRHGLVPVQGFFIPGLYEDRLESIFSDYVEIPARRCIEKLRLEGNGSLSSDEMAVVRRHLVLSYLRTPYAKTLFDTAMWNDMLADIAIDGFDRSKYSGESLKSEMALYRADFLSRSYIWLVSATHADDFLISDKGVTFLGPDDAIYPISRTEAIWATAEEEPPKLNLSGNSVLQINSTILSDFHNVLGMTAFERVYSSVVSIKDTSPGRRLEGLRLKARSLYNCGHPEFNSLLRKISGVYYVMIPTKFYSYLLTPADESTVSRCIEWSDYIGLSAILVFIRYGLLDLPSEPIEVFFRSIPDHQLRKILDKYVNDADYEFQKLQSFVFMEVASERGDGESADRLRRYYLKGRHTMVDQVKADYYLEKGCELGYPDCLIAYLKRIGPDPNYREKIGVYQQYFDSSVGSLLMALSKTYLENGDAENYRVYLEKAALTGYTGAVSQWFELIVSETPWDLSKIEAVERLSIDRQLSVSYELADFYSNNAEQFPGKLGDYIRRLTEAHSIFAEPLRDKYPDA